jgi:YfiH family protein
VLKTGLFEPGTADFSTLVHIRNLERVRTTPAALMVPELADEPGLVHGFSTLAVGSVGLKHATDHNAVLAARRAFTVALNLDGVDLTTIGSVHGSAVARVDEAGGSVDNVDALVTDVSSVALFATFADCFPIVLWDPEKRVAGLAHAGWRGTRSGIATAAVRFMQDEYGCTHIRAGLGPGICGRCYEVGEEVAAQFDSRFINPGAGGRWLLDLAAANTAQLEAEGAKAVYDIGICTKESYPFPSHRRHPDGARFGAIVSLR